MMKKTELSVLKKKRDGFVMKNNSNNIEIKCTHKFVEYWEKLGFVIIEQKKIRLVG